MSGSLPRLTKFADGITAVDTEYVRPQMDAAHIVSVGARAAIVDTGPNSAVPLILAALAELGIERDAVEYLFLTHVHLDHAGGAGALMRELPRATAVGRARRARRPHDPPPQPARRPPRAPRPRGRSRCADARAAAPHRRGAPTRRAAHDRSGQADRGHPRRVGAP